MRRARRLFASGLPRLVRRESLAGMCASLPLWRGRPLASPTVLRNTNPESQALEVHMTETAAIRARIPPLLLLLCLTVTLAAQAHQTVPKQTGAQAATAAERTSPLLVTGTLVNQNNYPLRDVRVTVHRADPEPNSYQEEWREGFLLNPNVQTDFDGNFALEVSNRWIPESGMIQLTAGVKRTRPSVDPNLRTYIETFPIEPEGAAGAALLITVKPDDRTIVLGKVRARIRPF